MPEQSTKADNWKVAIRFNKSSKKIDFALENDGTVSCFKSEADAYDKLKVFFAGQNSPPEIFLLPAHYYARLIDKYEMLAQFPGLIKSSDELEESSEVHRMFYDMAAGGCIAALPAMRDFIEMLKDENIKPQKIHGITKLVQNGTMMSCKSCNDVCLKPPVDMTVGQISKEKFDNLDENTVYCTMCAAVKLVAIVEVQQSIGNVGLLPSLLKLKQEIAKGLADKKEMTLVMQNLGNDFLRQRASNATYRAPVKADNSNKPWLN